MQNECCLCPDLPEVAFFCKCVLLAASFQAHSVVCPPLCIYVINHSLFCLETFKKKNELGVTCSGNVLKTKVWVGDQFVLTCPSIQSREQMGKVNSDDSSEKQKSWIQAPIYFSRKEAYEYLEGNFPADFVFSSP